MASPEILRDGSLENYWYVGTRKRSVDNQFIDTQEDFVGVHFSR